MPVERTGSGLFGADEVFCGEKKVADVDYHDVDVFDEYVYVVSQDSGRRKFRTRRIMRGMMTTKSGSIPLNVPLMLSNLKLKFQMTSATSFESLTEAE
jgi:hypothetical protein